MADNLSAEIRAINKRLDSPTTPKKTSNKKDSTIALSANYVLSDLPDEAYMSPNDGGWYKWLLIILAIDGALLAFALGRFIIFGL